MRPLVYFSEGYPTLSQTFTLREVRGLHADGIPVRVISLHAPRAMDPPLDPALDPPVTVLPSPFSPEVLRDLARGLAARPGAVSGLALRSVLPHTTPFHRIAQLRAPVHLAWAAHVARLLPEGAHLHAQFCGAASNVAWMAARMTGASFSFMAHSDHGLPFVREKLRDARFVLSISDFEKRRMLKAAPGVPAAKVEVLRLGVDVEAWDMAPPVPDASRPMRVLAVGMLGPTKGHDVLLQALALIDGPAVELDVVGEGAERPLLETLVRERRLAGRVRLRGALPHAQVRELVREADVVALACRITPSGDFDGIPIALMEGMAARRAVVSCTVSAIPELIEDGVSGLLVPPDAPLALARALTSLAKDPARRLALAEAGRRRIEDRHDAAKTRARLAESFRQRLA